MSTYKVEKFKVKKTKNVEADLTDYLNKVGKSGWTVLSVVAGLDTKGAGLVGNRPDSFLIVMTK